MDMCVCMKPLSWEVLFSINLCGEFSILLLKHLLLHSPTDVLKLSFPDPTREGVSECSEAFPPSWLTPQGSGPCPQVICLFFIFIFFPTSFWEGWLAFLEVWGLLPVFRSCSVGVVPLADEFLIYLCKEEGKVLSLSYSSTILNVLVVNIKCCKYYVR